MNWTFLIVSAILIVILEHNWASKKMCNLRYNTESTTILAEKDEEVCIESSIANISKLPITYIRITENLPDRAELIGGKYYIKDHLISVGNKRIARHQLALAPMKELVRKERFKLKERGVYGYGDYSVETGDFLGVKTITVYGCVPKHVAILPSKIENENVRAIVGGFLGDISVRRFIMEDPILTVGYNEYTGREPLRDISWTRTAVQGKMMVKKYDYTSELRVMILLNIEGGTVEEVERCLELSRMAIEIFEQKRIPYGFRTNGMLFGPEGSISYFPAGVGSQHYMTMMYGLAGALHGCWYSFESLVKTTLKGRGINEHYLVITVPTDAKATAVMNDLSRRTGAELCVLVGKEEEDV